MLKLQMLFWDFWERGNSLVIVLSTPLVRLLKFYQVETEIMQELPRLALIAQIVDQTLASPGISSSD